MARRATLADLLAKLEHEGRIIRNRRGAICLTDRAHLIKGRVQGHPDGFGFLVRDDGEADCFIGPRQMHKVMHGDRVVAREAGSDRRGRPEVIIVEVLPLAFRHGHLRVFGYRFGKLAYLTDVKAIPDTERGLLQGLEVLVVNALWWRPHPTHLSIAEAVEVAQALGARRTYLTHLTHETGHAELAARLPEGVMPAYDGLTVEIP